MATTELSNPITEKLDEASSVEEMISLLDSSYEELWRVLDDPKLQERIELIAAKLRSDPNSYLLLTGCGTSGRIAGFCKAAWKDEQVRYCIAGGPRALTLPVEGAEDNIEQGGLDAQEALKGVSHAVVCGITCGLSAPYVAGALQWALDNGHHPLLLGFTPPSTARPVFHQLVLPRLLHEDNFLVWPVGPESIRGSTRMKSGTATLVILHRLWTAWRGHACSFRPPSSMAPSLPAAVLAAGTALRAGRRLRYALPPGLGAALAEMDASECPPTFGASHLDVQARVDDVGKEDCVVSLRIHGESSPNQEEERRGAVVVALNLPEGVTFDSLQGWIQSKLYFNAISTLAHVIKGKVYGNRMIDLSLSNVKLVARATALVQELAQVSADAAAKAVWRSIFRSPSCSPPYDPLANPALLVQHATHLERVVPVAVLLAAGKAEDAQDALLKLSSFPMLRSALLALGK